MGMDLVRGNKSFSFSAIGWRELLELAVAFGWRPAGTLYAVADLVLLEPGHVAEEVARREREWGGWYTSNDWQRVTDVDAHALAMALYRAVEAAKHKLEVNEDQKRELERWIPETDRLELASLAEPLSAREINWMAIKRVADFVSAGGFEIA